jgi:hypothetical protein
VIALDFIPEQHEEGLKLGPRRESLLEESLHRDFLSLKTIPPRRGFSTDRVSPRSPPLLEASLLGALFSTEKCVNGHEKLDEESINSVLNRRGHLKVNEKQH